MFVKTEFLHSAVNRTPKGFDYINIVFFGGNSSGMRKYMHSFRNFIGVFANKSVCVFSHFWESVVYSKNILTLNNPS